LSHPIKRASVLTAAALALASGVAACGNNGPPASAQGGSGGLGAPSSGGSASGGATETSSGGNVGAGGTEGSGGAPSATGGSATGGQGSGGGDGSGGASSGGAGPTLPELVTSGPGDYWNTEAAVMETTAIPDLVVDESTQFQRWDGFGGTFNEMGWDALMAVSTEVTRALMLLFDAQEGANFAFGRIPIGASDYSMSWYTLAETVNDYAMEDFSIARDQEMLIPFIKAAQAVKPDIRFFASPWVVPNWMMDGSRNMKSDPQTLEAHALYFAKFVEAYAQEDIGVEAIHTQNEPGYARVNWTQELFIDFIKSYLGPKFVELDVDSEVWCGTMSHPDDGTIATTLAADTEAMQYVKGFGLQWNLQSTVADLAPFGPVMQTEHKCGNYSFETPYWDQSRYDPDQPQNDHLYGEESWQLIRDWIVAGVNSYVAWNMVLDTSGKSLDGWPQNALLVVDRSAQTLIVTPAYHVFRHFSQYIAPGATRIEITGSSDSLAFLNPDGSIVTEVYNSGDTAKVVTTEVGARTVQFEVPSHGWATLRVVP
jgi:glucosylceramidase